MRAADGNAMSLSDVDAVSGFVQVTLSAVGGVLTLGGTSNLTFSVGDGVSDATITFTGTLPDLNTALEGTVFTPAQDFAGAAKITIIADDLGNTRNKRGETVHEVDHRRRRRSERRAREHGAGRPVDERRLAAHLLDANGNVISVADVDAASLRVTLFVHQRHADVGRQERALVSGGRRQANLTMTFDPGESQQEVLKYNHLLRGGAAPPRHAQLEGPLCTLGQGFVHEQHRGKPDLHRLRSRGVGWGMRCWRSAPADAAGAVGLDPDVVAAEARRGEYGFPRPDELQPLSVDRVSVAGPTATFHEGRS